ncbi:amidohydrolase family protein [Achromobacter aloeverae]|uniref:2-pyrone-4,6-dicarboxylate hydrolase n=1 Tax=Achromobacter aloeverae TaxID=1750518 RepID=A0A4Q1HGH4_9BURK|nr:amidohydrolase family protein [Achromobacter aloeverae]RXN85284.1 2-pyrone-4,6-dicarboxylate hydrolase [Achromobacter aloeverae]
MEETTLATGTHVPKALPSGACDSHLHLYDTAIIDAPAAPNPLAGCTAGRYRALRDSLGLQRAVIVTPAPHVVDNRVTLAAIQALGARDTRGVGVVFPDVTDAELQRLHDGGIRGIRFTVAIPRTAVTRIDMLPALAPRVHALGWHVQLHMTPAQIVESQAIIERLPCGIVFDHMARLADGPLDERAWAIVQDRLQTGRTWVKLSGHYLAADAATARNVASRLAAAAPERMVWGSDWPHPTEMPTPPETASTLAVLEDWVPDAGQRKRILVDNPEQLYGFK